MDDLISRLSEIRSQYNCFNKAEEPYYRALSEAIKKLSERVDGGTISRQAAIDAINSHFGFNIEEEYGSAVQEVINGLPSAQPEILTCEDCKYADDKSISDGRHWCNIHSCYMYYCSDAER